MFRRPAATPEQECHKAPAALGTQVAVYEDSIGQLILQWLRKPTYWSEGSSGTQALWHAYTPEPVTPSELALSRQACGVACDAQPVDMSSRLDRKSVVRTFSSVPWDT